LLEQCDTVAQTAVDQNGVVIAAGDPVRVPTQQPARVDLRPRRWLQIAPQLATPPPRAGRVLNASGYRFPPRLRRFLEARDRTCIFPGCGRPARKTDKDHRIPWPEGATDADNGECLCRHHHRAKHTVFTVRRDPNGDYLWIS